MPSTERPADKSDRTRRGQPARVVEVEAVERLPAGLIRIVFGGPGLDGFTAGEFTDHYVKLHFPPRGAVYRPPFDPAEVHATLPREQWSRTRAAAGCDRFAPCPVLSHAQSSRPATAQSGRPTKRSRAMRELPTRISNVLRSPIGSITRDRPAREARTPERGCTPAGQANVHMPAAHSLSTLSEADRARKRPPPGSPIRDPPCTELRSR